MGQFPEQWFVKRGHESARLQFFLQHVQLANGGRDFINAVKQVNALGIIRRAWAKDGGESLHSVVTQHLRTVEAITAHSMALREKYLFMPVSDSDNGAVITEDQIAVPQ